MSAAAARAEARRKAILSRGTDRLAKLTTSARGEEGGTYFEDSSSAPSTRSFLGEESGDMPPPASLGRGTSPKVYPQPQTQTQTKTQTPTPPESSAPGTPPVPAGRPIDPMAWLPEQQERFAAALRHANAQQQNQQQQQQNHTRISLATGTPITPLAEPGFGLGQGQGQAAMEDQLATLLGLSGGSQVGGEAGGAFPASVFGGAGGFGPPGFGPPGLGLGAFGAGPGVGGQDEAMQQQPQQQTKLQKALPLLHLVAVWCLLAYFILWVEPRAVLGAAGEGGVGWAKFWRRWALLGGGERVGALGGIGVGVVPFFWAFTTLQIVLHSLRIFSGFDTVQPPALLALALPHLPAPLPGVIVNGMKYMQMGSLFLDDLAGLIVGLGFVVYFAGWIAQG